jgi:hypothetical protein
MRAIDKADKLSTHFAKVSEEQIGAAIEAAHESVKNILNLPKDVKVSGLKFDIDDGGPLGGDNGPCVPKCTMDKDGKTHCDFC